MSIRREPKPVRLGLDVTGPPALGHTRLMAGMLADDIADARDMVWIEGATFVMGSDYHYPEERPARLMTLDDG